MADNTPYINLREITDWAKYHINELYGLVSAPGSTSWGSISGTLSAQSDLQGALNNKQPIATVLTNTTASFTSALETKLNGIASGATAYTDEMAQDAVSTMIQNGTGITWSYNDGANTLTPTVTITQYTDEMVDDRVASLLTAGTNITLTYNDGAGTLTIDAAGGGSGLTHPQVMARASMGM